MPERKGGNKDRKQDKIDRDEIEEEYGLSYALFKAFPELNQLLRKAVNENWTPGKFQVELRQTRWFKKHSDVWRENIALSYSDPATFRERLNTMEAQVRDLAQATSADLTKKGTNRLARRALLFGMDEAELRDVLARHVRPSKAGNYGGELAGVQAQLEETMMLNGIDVKNKRVRSWMRQVVRGNSGIEELQRAVRRMAARQFPLYEEQVTAGMDLADIATPYMQSMASVLELNPTALTVNDRTIRKALSGMQTNNGKTVPMSIQHFEDELRQDKRWLYTKNAKDQAAGYASNLARMWGLL